MAAPVKYTVFISSTHDDLQDEREQVTDAILKLGHIPCGMEQFSAGAGRGWEVITQTIDLCDYYVLIVAGRYGSDFPGEVKSWTEKEYEYAKSKGLDVIAFLRDEKSFAAADMDTEHVRVEKRKAFIQRINDECRREVWTNAYDLCARVTMALTKQIADDNGLGKGRPGWYRGDDLPVDRDMSKAMSLQTIELAELKAKVATFTPKAVLQLQHEGGGPILDVFELVRPEYILEGSFLPPNVGMPRQRKAEQKLRDWADSASRLCWLSLRLFNSGGAPATKVRAHFTFSPVEKVIIEKLEPPTQQTYDSYAIILPVLLPRNIDSIEVDEEFNGFIKQRVDSVGVNRERDLIRMGIILREDGGDGSIVPAKVTYKIDEEGGAQLEGQFELSLSREGEFSGEAEALAEHANR
jgi:hypothetical protein